jgi:hypothetical protein
VEGCEGQAQTPGTLTAGAPGRRVRIPSAAGGARACTSLLLFCIAFPACAGIYRWRDEQGRIQYGDHPPAGVAAEPVEADPAPATRGSSPDRRIRRERVLDVLGEERKQRDAARAAEEAALRERREQCERARRQLEETRNASFLYEPGSDPANPRILSDSERAAYTREGERAVERLCGP